MHFFDYDSYKSAICSIITDRKEKGLSKINFQGLAERCRIQKTYLSRVLNHDAHLTRDQLHLASEYLGLKVDEKNYLLLLHDFEISVLQDRKKELKLEIQAIKSEHTRTEEFANVERITTGPEFLSTYYLDPYFTIIHIFLTVERFRTKPKLIGEILNLNAKQLSFYLEKLEQAGVICFRKGFYSVELDNIHLPKESQLQPAYRLSMRLKALEQLARADDNNYSFSVVFSTTPKIQKLLKSKFLEYLKDAQGLIGSNAEEQVYQMNFDLVSWSTKSE